MCSAQPKTGMRGGCSWVLGQLRLPDLLQGAPAGACLFCGLPGFRAVCFANVGLGAHFEVPYLGWSRFTVHTFGFSICFCCNGF